MKYTAERKFATEEEAKEGLDTCGYAGKWKSAKESCQRTFGAVGKRDFWDAVRLRFLELGGEWLAQMGPQDPRHADHKEYLARVAAMPRGTLITPTFEYREPQKVRFA